jgi:hypothetical protein
MTHESHINKFRGMQLKVTISYFCYLILNSDCRESALILVSEADVNVGERTDGLVRDVFVADKTSSLRLPTAAIILYSLHFRYHDIHRRHFSLF